MAALGTGKFSAVDVSTLSVSLSTSISTPTFCVAVSTFHLVAVVGLAVVTNGVVDVDASKCGNIARWKSLCPVVVKLVAGGISHTEKAMAIVSFAAKTT